MTPVRPTTLTRIAVSAALFCVLSGALAVAALWWKGTREAEKVVALRLDAARVRTAELESAASAGRCLEEPWTALRDLGIRRLGWDEALGCVRDVLRAKGTKAGVRIAEIVVRAGDDPVPSEVGCALEIRTRVEGSSAGIANWLYLLETSCEPMFWIDSVTWVSTGDPQDMRCDAVVRTPLVDPAEES